MLFFKKQQLKCFNHSKKDLIKLCVDGKVKFFTLWGIYFFFSKEWIRKIHLETRHLSTIQFSVDLVTCIFVHSQYAHEQHIAIRQLKEHIIKKKRKLYPRKKLIKKRRQKRKIWLLDRLTFSCSLLTIFKSQIIYNNCTTEERVVSRVFIVA